MPDAWPVTRHVLRIGERAVHYRHAGSGPALVLLHQSPRSSAEFLELMQDFAGQFSVFAPDTPGYGLSDAVAPADEEPDIDRFVDALAGFFGALGLSKACVYGTHTGAILGVRLAVRYPDLVERLVANGILLMPESERADMLAQYFVGFVPRWDAGHLAWLWSRLREQLRFYPWYKRSSDNRINWQMPLAEIHASACDMLAAGDNYRAGYRAVLDYQIELDLVRLAVPTRIIMVEKDALSIYAERLPALPAGVALQRLPDFCDVPGAARDFFVANAGAVWNEVPLATAGGRLVDSRFEDAGGVTLHVRARGHAALPAVVVLHAVGGSAMALQPLLAAMDGCAVAAPDLPGHGESAALPGAPDIERVCACLAAWLDGLAHATCTLVTLGDAAGLGVRLAALRPHRIERIVMCNPSAGEERALPPPLEPDMSGAYLIRLWSYLRDDGLHWPWRDGEILPPTPVELQRRLRDWLAAGESARGLAESLRHNILPQRVPCPVETFFDPANAPPGTKPSLPHRLRDWPPLIAPQRQNNDGGFGGTGTVPPTFLT